MPADGFNQSDLDLIEKEASGKKDEVVDHKAEAEAAAQKTADDKAAADKADAAKEDKDTDVFDGLDDGDDADADEAKSKTKEKTEDKAEAAKDADETADQKRDRLAADAAWRDRIAERLLAPLKDKLSAAKFEKRREQIIGQLKRSKSMDEAVISGIMAQEKLRSGEHRKAPDGDEELATWRKENDIPAAADAYTIPKIAGKEWTDADEPMINGFKAVAHEMNLPQAVVNQLVTWNVKESQRVEAEYEQALKKADRTDKEICHDKLRAEFGISEFKPSMAIMQRLVEDEDIFGGAKAELMSARYFNTETGQWHRLTSNPIIARGLIAMAAERYGEGAMAGDSGGGSQTNRISELEKLRDTNRDEYFRSGGADELMKLQQAEEARAVKRRR